MCPGLWRYFKELRFIVSWVRQTNGSTAARAPSRTTLRAFCEPEFHRLYGESLLLCSPSATAEAESRLRTAIALAQERQMKALELRAALSLAHLFAPRDRAAARDALAVVDWFTEGADVADLRSARALRDELH